MKCKKCDSRCCCVDTREELSYGKPEKRLLNVKPVRMRKYICNTCNIGYITSEFIEGSYFAKSEDQRIAKAEDNARKAKRKLNKKS
jgi:hypothetical protein